MARSTGLFPENFIVQSLQPGSVVASVEVVADTDEDAEDIGTALEAAMTDGLMAFDSIDDFTAEDPENAREGDGEGASGEVAAFVNDESFEDPTAANVDAEFASL